jgi:NADPH:quinone reductase-like Zn-dependent oxidoreductase
MRALAIAERGAAPAVQDLPVIEPAPGQVRLAVQAASVNGFDVAVAAGYVWDMIPHEFPVVLGRDFAGAVEAMDEGVSGVQLGDRLCGVITGMTLAVGGIATMVTVDAASVVPVPEAVTSAQAAGLGLAAITALGVVNALELSGDDVVLVSGATGGVGSYVVQLAVQKGATVLATARPGDATDYVRDLGAAEAVDYSADVAAAVRSAASDGVTAVVHAAGDPAALAAVLRPGGRMASVLGASVDQLGRDDVAAIPVLAGDAPAKLRSLLDMAAAGTLRIPITRTYPFDDSAQAISDFGTHKLGKLLIEVR